ncbi:MAG: alpha/beta fold hydrolase [Anaerolineales bacterium]
MAKRVLPTIILLAVATAAGLARPDLPADVVEARYGQPPSQFMEIDGVRLHYRDQGAGPPLVLIHGTFSSLHTWDGWAETLSADYRLLRLDLPGHGLTGPRHDGDYSRGADAELLADWLDRLGVERASLAGNSLGGAIALRFALAHPDRVDKLILIDSTGLPVPQEAEPIAIFQILEVPILRNAAALFTPRFFFRQTLEGAYAQDDRITEELVDRYYLLMRREGNRAALLQRMQTRDQPLADRYSTIEAPTLIMWGEQDSWIPVENAFRFEEVLPTVEVVVIEEAGHMPMEERPGVTAELAEEFLAR